MAKPFGFEWVVPDRIAAMGRPHDLRRDLESLKDQQIDVIVTLTVAPLQSALIEEFGFETRHIPIPDFQAPRMAQIEAFVRALRQAARKRQRVVVHCGVGRGRTGTMLACYFVSRGRSAEAALEEVRRLRPGSVETAEQEEAIRAFARRWTGNRRQRKKRPR